MSSATVKPALPIKLRSVPFLSRRWLGGIETWGSLSAVHCGLGRGQLHLDFGDEDTRLGVQVLAQLRNVGRDGFANVGPCFLVAGAFADTAGQGRDFNGVAAFFGFTQGDQISDSLVLLDSHNSDYNA